MQEIKSRKSKDFSSVVNKRKVSRFEMDDFFTGG